MERNRKLEEYFEEARENRKRKGSSVDFKIIKDDTVYPALILDAYANEDWTEIEVLFIVYNSPWGTKWKVKFKVTGDAVRYYEEFCDMLDADGNPEKLIGKCAFLHLKKNGIFKNVRIDALISRKELRQAVAELEREDEIAGEIEEDKSLKRKKKKKRVNVRSKEGVEENFEVDDDLSDFN